jgi:hypothetical protein
MFPKECRRALHVVPEEFRYIKNDKNLHNKQCNGLAFTQWLMLKCKKKMFNVLFIIKFLNFVFLMVSMVYSVHLPQEQN